MQSTFYEQVVEHIFIAELLQEAWLRYDKVVKVVRSAVEAYGYDLILAYLKKKRHNHGPAISATFWCLATMDTTEIRDYIRQLATEHQAPNTDYDELELAAFRAILRFALTEGFEADSQVVHKTLHGADGSDEDDDHTTWDYMYLLLDVCDARLATHRLPPKTAELYQFWKAAFWPSPTPE